MSKRMYVNVLKKLLSSVSWDSHHFTPFHTNTVAAPGDVELPLIRPTSTMHRYLQIDPPKEIMCMEKLIPVTLKEFTPYVTKYVCMSPKYSATVQAANLTQLFTEWNMCSDDTLLNIVDFGGDILTDGTQSSIISPGLDAYTLAVVRNLNAYQSNIAVCFPGIDGELSADYLSRKCNTCVAKYDIDVTIWRDTLIAIHDKLKLHRPGNTIPNMISVFRGERCHLSKSWNVCGEKFTFTRDFNVNMDLQRHIYVFDSIDNPFVNVFNVIDYDLVKVIKHITKIYSAQVIDTDTFQSSDFFLQYLRKDANGTWTNKCFGGEVMLVDIIPTIMLDKKDDIEHKINLFDVRYTDLIAA